MWAFVIGIHKVRICLDRLPVFFGPALFIYLCEHLSQYIACLCVFFSNCALLMYVRICYWLLWANNMWPDLGKPTLWNFFGANWIIGTIRMRISLCIDLCNWHCDRHFHCKVIAYSMCTTGKTLFRGKTRFIAHWLHSNNFCILCRRLLSPDLQTRPPMVRVCVEWLADGWQRFYCLPGRVY